MNTRIITGCTAAWTVFACIGCEVAPRKGVTEHAVVPLILFEEQSAAVPVLASALFEPQPETVDYEIVSGREAGDIVTVHRSETTQFGAAWAEQENDSRTEFYRAGENGSILLIAAIDYGDRAISLFDPPLTAVHASLSPGESRAEESAMRVVDLNDPRRVRESGTARQSAEHLGRWRIGTSHGEFVADRIRVHFDADLRMARAAVRTTLYVVDGVGVLAIERDETITALGLFTRRSHRTMVRRDLPPRLEPEVETGR